MTKRIEVVAAKVLSTAAGDVAASTDPKGAVLVVTVAITIPD